MVDAEARRTELAEAVWRIIMRDGLEQASVRNVAREAGLSMGSLRHYFATQSELLGFALRLVGDRIEARLRAVDITGDQRHVVLAMIDEMLPLDRQRRGECEVWLAFTARAAVEPSLASLREEIDARLAEAFQMMIRRLADSGALRPELDHTVEAERLYALVDGVILHAVLQPSRMSGAAGRAVIAAHLAQIAPRDPGAA
ncbi:TetR family transcriptional regulator C-terminal domain-containing protein [Micromonospora sp. DR5-3]|uniref:TetR/AcrR family transcriptional regulator n=1 Tax=unclassified Micromonospora TaxID=2617518 RepID=UPI0011D34F21|nr:MULTISPECIES: TetR family transcriptional regulator C-terminal domain-containing protein [unclassified Micromonospora]MCW3814032.1 TetR family transcriptional regulator C-terminal domain-containing protein [Micromonospora sp. DR5-3]TYC23615.1 TetR family transcriptional regulator [Micromonospora sp. MP36]